MNIKIIEKSENKNNPEKKVFYVEMEGMTEDEFSKYINRIKESLTGKV